MLGTFNGGGSDGAIVSSVMGDAAARGLRRGARLSVGHASQRRRARSRTTSRSGRPSTSAATTPGRRRSTRREAPNDQAYAVESWGLIRDWIRAGVTAYSAWNMVLDTVGVGIDTTRVWPQNALLTVDTAAKTLNVTPTYYVFRHLSQFVAPGAKVVAARGGDALAFKNPDGSIVAVMYNAGAAKTLTVATPARSCSSRCPATAGPLLSSRADRALPDAGGRTDFVTRRRARQTTYRAVRSAPRAAPGRGSHGGRGHRLQSGATHDPPGAGFRKRCS